MSIAETTPLSGLIMLPNKWSRRGPRGPSDAALAAQCVLN